ncbi:hypothetical protein G9409_09445 [Chlorobium sp. BLA1]|uniref:hypothetical protein n=1 Tax=Candidatus Chlorobium masyuteum TaxID=2716876 RepID=UPI0014242B10|nr:hypothetical protein [Candidatus Chlorobium masyuteum]NHQ60800.1 hypothetical protein [Candidatus Chlorobium masyuteum]
MKKTAQLTLLESAIKGFGYSLRYEKGNFLGGECRLRDDNVVVVNKFLPLEGKIYTLALVISKLNPPGLSAEIAKIVDSLIGTTLFNRDLRR